MPAQKSTLSINIFMHKEEIEDFSGCLKTDLDWGEVAEYEVKKSIGLRGNIYVHNPTTNIPDWKPNLNKLTDSHIELEPNKSNRALVILKYNNRFFSITFGYGRYMINFDTIVNNFGLKVAANIIDNEKVKSLRSTSFESSLLHTQKQVPKLVNQDQFRVNKDLEMLKEVSGSPTSESTARFIVGSDSLKISRKMDIEDIKESIEFYYLTYNNKDYISKGFGWIDNVQEVRDTRLKEKLNTQLCENILLEETDVIISASDITDWNTVQGFSFTGINDETTSMNLENKLYFDYLRNNLLDKSGQKVLDKLKRDCIVSINTNGIPETVSTVYNGIYYETIYDEKRYLLEDGNWYQIDSNFYKRIVNQLQRIPTNSIVLDSSLIDEDEGAYNSRVGEGENIFCLDKNNFSFDGFGKSSMEASDLITKEKHLIHVKVRKGNGSSVLSHWFAQGKISAEVLSQDRELREFINNEVSIKFGEDFISENDRNSDFEIVFALILEKEGEVIDNLPFFSMVNLAKTVDELAISGFNFSLCKIDKEVVEEETTHQLELIPN